MRSAERIKSERQWLIDCVKELENDESAKASVERFRVRIAALTWVLDDKDG